MTEPPDGRHDGDHEDRVLCQSRCIKITRDGICTWCTERLRRQLADIPELWVTLHTKLAPGGGGGSAPVSGTREVPQGVRWSVLSFIGPASADAPVGWLDDQDDTVPLPAVLSGWVRLAAEELGLHPVDWTVPGMARLLLVQHERLAGQAWADDLAEEINEAWGVARRLLGMIPPRPEPKVGVPCDRCDLMSLVQHPGSDDVSCANPDCQRVMRRDEYVEYLRTIVPGRVADCGLAG